MVNEHAVHACAVAGGVGVGGFLPPARHLSEAPTHPCGARERSARPRPARAPPRPCPTRRRTDGGRRGGGGKEVGCERRTTPSRGRASAPGRSAATRSPRGGRARRARWAARPPAAGGGVGGHTGGSGGRAPAPRRPARGRPRPAGGAGARRRGAAGASARPRGASARRWAVRCARIASTARKGTHHVAQAARLAPRRHLGGHEDQVHRRSRALLHLGRSGRAHTRARARPDRPAPPGARTSAAAGGLHRDRASGAADSAGGY